MKRLIWFIGILAAVILFVSATPCLAERYALIILPVVGGSPVCVDPENCTGEESEAISAWQDDYDNLWGLYAKIKKAEDWLIDGEYVDIVYPGKGVLVTKAGQYGTAVWFLMDRILKPDPAVWFITKVAAMRDAGWIFRGYATDDPHQELLDRNYVIVGSEQ